MTAPDDRDMHDELAHFEAALHEAARAIVLEALTAEYTRRIAAGEGQVADEDEDEVEAPAPAAAPEAAPAVTTPVAPGSSSSERRGRWTHASVIDELCTWLLGGSAVEASYLRRHGAPGLVSAAKRLFGRFEAALNAANLVLAQRYPDGPPSRRAQQRMAAPPRPRAPVIAPAPPQVAEVSDAEAGAPTRDAAAPSDAPIPDAS